MGGRGVRGGVEKTCPSWNAKKYALTTKPGNKSRGKLKKATRITSDAWGGWEKFCPSGKETSAKRGKRKGKSFSSLSLLVVGEMISQASGKCPRGERRSAMKGKKKHEKGERKATPLLGEQSALHRKKGRITKAEHGAKEVSLGKRKAGQAPKLSPIKWGGRLERKEKSSNRRYWLKGGGWRHRETPERLGKRHMHHQKEEKKL